MAINSMENAVRYSDELDKMFEQKSAVGFFADSALATKFVGAKTVIIPDIDFYGLTDYDRDTGFARGAITVSNTSYTMAMDRARSLQIDREDMSETGIANLAGKILGEYVRTKVVPECDAYVISKLASLAVSRANVIEGDVTKPYEALCDLIGKVQAEVGYNEELVAFVDSYIYAALQNSSEISKMINVTDFKQGNIDLKVRSINGVALIPVVSERMKTAYEFASDTTGGFTPASGCNEIYMLVCPKNGAHLVKKTENMRIFTPDQNIDADAYKFDYRIYYDVFVKKSGLDAVWTWVSPSVTMAFEETATVSGDAAATLKINAESEGSLTYQWYVCEDEKGNGAVKIAGATEATYNLPADTEEGTYYLFVRVCVDGIATTDSEVKAITVG